MDENDKKGIISSYTKKRNPESIMGDKAPWLPGSDAYRSESIDSRSEVKESVHNVQPGSVGKRSRETDSRMVLDEQKKHLQRFHQHLRNGSTRPAAALVDRLPDNLIPEARNLVEAFMEVKDAHSKKRPPSIARYKPKITKEEFLQHWNALSVMVRDGNANLKYMAGYNLERYGIDIMGKLGVSIREGALESSEFLVKCMREELQGEAKELLTAFGELKKRRQDVARKYYRKYQGSTSKLAPYWCALGALLGEPGAEWEDVKGFQLDRYRISWFDAWRLRRMSKRAGTELKPVSTPQPSRGWAKSVGIGIPVGCGIALAIMCLAVVGGGFWIWTTTSGGRMVKATIEAFDVQMAAHTQTAYAWQMTASVSPSPLPTNTGTPTLASTPPPPEEPTLSPAAADTPTASPLSTETAMPSPTISPMPSPTKPETLREVDLRAPPYAPTPAVSDPQGYYSIDTLYYNIQETPVAGKSYMFKTYDPILVDLTSHLDLWIRNQTDEFVPYAVEVCLASVINQVTKNNESGDGYFGLAFAASEKTVDSGDGGTKQVSDWQVFAVSVPLYVSDYSGKLFQLGDDIPASLSEELIIFSPSDSEPCFKYTLSKLLRVEFRADGAHFFLNGVESEFVIPNSPSPIRIGLWAQPSGGKLHVEIRTFVVEMLPK